MGHGKRCECVRPGPRLSALAAVAKALHGLWHSWNSWGGEAITRGNSPVVDAGKSVVAAAFWVQTVAHRGDVRCWDHMRRAPDCARASWEARRRTCAAPGTRVGAQRRPLSVTFTTPESGCSALPEAPVIDEGLLVARLDNPAAVDEGDPVRDLLEIR